MDKAGPVAEWLDWARAVFGLGGTGAISIPRRIPLPDPEVVLTMPDQLSGSSADDPVPV